MSVEDRLRAAFSGMASPGARALRLALETTGLAVQDLEPFLDDPGDRPYGRRLLFKNDQVEVLVMNWAVRRECVPHDHGCSHGWFQIVSGEALHSVYSLDGLGLPALRKTTTVGAGRWLYAPKGLVHSMGNPTNDAAVTLHVYSPPITRMRVYNTKMCKSCIVRDDCGAWLPSSEQIVEEISLIPKRATSDLPS